MLTNHFYQNIGWTRLKTWFYTRHSNIRKFLQSALAMLPYSAWRTVHNLAFLFHLASLSSCPKCYVLSLPKLNREAHSQNRLQRSRANTAGIIGNHLVKTDKKVIRKQAGQRLLQIHTKGVHASFWHVSVSRLKTRGVILKKRIHKGEPTTTLDLLFILIIEEDLVQLCWRREDVQNAGVPIIDTSGYVMY